MKEYLYKPDTDPFHSHGMAKLAHGGGIGATNSETYRQRIQREKSRQHVKRYKDSHVVRRRAGQQLSTGFERYQGAPERSLGHERATGASAPVARRFTEPQPRQYNPYH